MPTSSAAQNYLKAIYAGSEWTGGGVTTSALAARLAVAPSSVSESVRRLAVAGLVEHEPYGRVTLTERGRAEALAVVRRHRIVETYLVERLGYSWDEVHEEAEELEHAMSDRLLERMDAALGRPRRDPHGDPIPSADGVVPLPPAVPLGDLPAGARGLVARISDAEPRVLRHLAELGIGLDAPLVVVAPLGDGEAGGARIGWRDLDIELDAGSVMAIWVVPLEEGQVEGSSTHAPLR